MRLSMFLAGLVVAFGLAAPAAKAAEIIWFYQAELVDGVGEAPEGLQIEGFLAFDDETDGEPLDGGGTGYTDAINLFVALSPEAPPLFGGADLGDANGILIVNDSAGVFIPPIFSVPENNDAFIAFTLADVFGMPFAMVLTLIDDTPEEGADWLTSEALLSTVPDLGDLTSAFIILTNRLFGGRDDGEGGEEDGNITLIFRLTALQDRPFDVPAPAPLLLLISGFAGLALLRRRG